MQTRSNWRPATLLLARHFLVFCTGTIGASHSTLATADASGSATIEIAKFQARVSQHLPKGAGEVDYVVVRGTVLESRLVSRSWTEYSGRVSLRSFAEITLAVISAKGIGHVATEVQAMTLVDPNPIYYHPITGEKTQTTSIADYLGSDGDKTQEVVNHGVYAPIGSEMMLVAFRSRDGRTRFPWMPHLGVSFAIVAALNRDRESGFVEALDPGPFDRSLALGEPGTLVPAEAWKPVFRIVDGSPEAIESALFEAVEAVAR